MSDEWPRPANGIFDRRFLGEPTTSEPRTLEPANGYQNTHSIQYLGETAEPKKASLVIHYLPGTLLFNKALLVKHISDNNKEGSRFRDRLDDSYKEFGRYHALDLYTITATTTEEEWRYALELSGQQRDQPYVLEAGRLVSEHFSSLDRLGMIRLRESPYYRPELQLDEFMSALQELFPATVKTNPEGN